MTEGILITKPISGTAGGIAVYVTGLIIFFLVPLMRAAVWWPKRLDYNQLLLV